MIGHTGFNGRETKLCSISCNSQTVVLGVTDAGVVSTAERVGASHRDVDGHWSSSSVKRASDSEQSEPCSIERLVVPVSRY